jgi:hypothetical protein
MRTRTSIAAVMLMGILATACGDSFNVEDTLGIWDIRRVNGDEVPGTVWIRASTGDSAQIELEAFYFDFLAAPDCSYTIDAAGVPSFTNDLCGYAVGEDGDVSITLEGTFSVTGTTDGQDMALTDEDGNAFQLMKRP